MIKKISILLLAFGLLSCRKYENLKIIAGNWELRKMEGGFAGSINYPAGNGNIYSFTSGGSYKFINTGGVEDSGIYSLKKVAFTNNWYLNLKSLQNNYVYVDSITIKGNELIILPRPVCCDVPTVTYKKLSY